MKILLYILISFAATGFSFCKDYAGFPLWRGPGGGHPSNPTSQEDTLIYTDFDEPAQFPGGNLSLLKHLRENINYPATEIDFLPEKCFVSFVVEKDGSLTHITITRSSGIKAFDTEVIRVISVMPKWIPAKNQGKIVRSEFFLPVHIHFK